MSKMLKAIGLMSGTSLDGIDVALLETDGVKLKNPQQFLTVPYKDSFREALKNLMAGKGDMLEVERDLTIAHAHAVKKFIKKFNIKNVDLIGFHGQTIFHRPKEGITLQIGNGALLAELTGINVICDFRTRDVANGGQGAPLVPLYHAAVVRSLKGPIALLNIGGISNITYIGDTKKENSISAFDCGPANAIINDLVKEKTGAEYDKDGALAAKGKVNQKILNSLLSDKYFKTKPPKSLDRNHFHQLIKNSGVYKLKTEDGVATLTAFVAEAIILSEKLYSKKPAQWFICGGGRKNKFLVKYLSKKLKGDVKDIAILKMNGDATEAEAFAFLAVRSYYGMSLSLPSTTGCRLPVTGGAFYQA